MKHISYRISLRVLMIRSIELPPHHYANTSINDKSITVDYIINNRFLDAYHQYSQ
jgi:hypothetical protein